MPLDIGQCSVDDKGRLKLPASFLQEMVTENAWFASLDIDGRSLTLRTTGESANRIEIDTTGRIFLRSDLSGHIRGKSVYIAWAGGDRLVVMTSIDYEQMIAEALKPHRKS